MGISPKTETRRHNFSFFEPYPIGAPRALRRSLSVGLRHRFNVPARTVCINFVIDEYVVSVVFGGCVVVLVLKAPRELQQLRVVS